MRVRVTFLYVVDIVGSYQLEPHIGGPRDKLAIDFSLLSDAVIV